MESSEAVRDLMGEDLYPQHHVEVAAAVRQGEEVSMVPIQGEMLILLEQGDSTCRALTSTVGDYGEVRPSQWHTRRGPSQACAENQGYVTPAYQSGRRQLQNYTPKDQNSHRQTSTVPMCCNLQITSSFLSSYEAVQLTHPRRSRLQVKHHL